MAFAEIPTELEFKTACGRTGAGKYFKTKKDLDEIFATLKAAESVRKNQQEAAIPPLRKVRKACCAWIAKNTAVTRVSKPKVKALCDIVHERITEIVEQTYGLRRLGLAQKTHRPDPPPGVQPIKPHIPTLKNVAHRVMEVTQIKGNAPLPVGKTLEDSYWIEKMLRNHVGKIAVGGAMTEWKSAKSKTKLNVQDWLDQIFVPECEDDPSGAYLGNNRAGRFADKITAGTGVRYCDAEERKSYVMTIKGGLVTDAQGQTADTSDMKTVFSGQEWAIFVMAPSPDNTLYFHSHVADAFHHSSFLAGAPIASGGEIRIREGKITDVTPKTGHYKAGAPELKYFLEFCQKQGIRLGDVKVCPKPFEDPKKWFQGNAVLAANGDEPTPKQIAEAAAAGPSVKTLIKKWENIGKPGVKT